MLLVTTKTLLVCGGLKNLAVSNVNSELVTVSHLYLTLGAPSCTCLYNQNVIDRYVNVTGSVYRKVSLSLKKQTNKQEHETEYV